MSRKAFDYLPRRIRNQFMEELYGLATDGLFLLDEAARQLAIGEPSRSELEDNVLVTDAISRRDALRERFEAAARNASQFFYLRGVLLLGTVVLVALAWFVAEVFPSPISRHDAAWALASGGIGALVSVLLRVKTSGLVLDYRVGPLRLLFLGAIRPLLGGIAGVLFLLATIGGVIPLAGADGTAQRVALYVLGSFAAGFNERWVARECRREDPAG